MPKFFRRKKDRPLNFSYIEQGKQRRGYSGWIIGAVLLMVIVLIIFFLF